MYVVYAGGVAQSIPLSLEEAKEFAHETNMDFEVRDLNSHELVYSAAEYAYGAYYVEIECQQPVWLEEAI